MCQRWPTAVQRRAHPNANERTVDQLRIRAAKPADLHCRSCGSTRKRRSSRPVASWSLDYAKLARVQGAQIHRVLPFRKKTSHLMDGHDCTTTDACEHARLRQTRLRTLRLAAAAHLAEGVSGSGRERCR